jgi:hypothetical protein
MLLNGYPAGLPIVDKKRKPPYNHAFVDPQ